MQNLPSWLEQSFKEVRCPHCFFPLQRVGVMALGLRISKRQEGKTVAFFEHECMECKRASMYEIHEMSSENFALSLLEDKDHRSSRPEDALMPSVPSSLGEYQPIVRPSLPGGLSEHPISDQEVLRFLRRLKRTSFRRNTRSFIRWLEQLCGRST